VGVTTIEARGARAGLGEFAMEEKRIAVADVAGVSDGQKMPYEKPDILEEERYETYVVAACSKTTFPSCGATFRFS
jgi:hypothetical protein